MSQHDSRPFPAPRGAAAAEDAALVRRVLDGDVDPFEELIARHQDAVLAVVARHAPRALAQELAHETFVRAYLSLGRYRPARPLAGWLACIALRVCCDHWRRAYRERRRGFAAGATDGGLDQLAAAPDEPAERAAERDLVAFVLDQLGLEDRLVLALHHLEGRSFAECAALLGWSTANVKVRAHRARRRLRRLLLELQPAPADGSRRRPWIENHEKRRDASGSCAAPSGGARRGPRARAGAPE